MKKPYRKNVGIVVFNKERKVLTGERRDYSGYVQFPQGGIEDTEEPLEAAYRELKEETGLVLKSKPVHEIADWLYYDFPSDIPEPLKAFQGQKQKWFFFFWDGSLKLLEAYRNEREEFAALHWSDFACLPAQIVPFKKRIYETLYIEGSPFIDNYIAGHRR